MMQPIRTAVILAAGLGTRMLPATKAVPKEMLPIVDKPLIQYAVEEAVAAGIEHIVIVVADGKEAIVEHFAAGGPAVERVRAKGKAEATAAAEAPAKLARFSYATQPSPRGAADAVACAKSLVANAPFALMFPDDVILGDVPCIGQLIDVHRQYGGTVIAVEHVPDAEIANYGIIAPADDANPARVRALVEKPSAADAPSNLGIVGRYVLAPSIFDQIAALAPGAGGELQITDAIARQVAAGEAVHAFAYDGDRYDTGRPGGYVEANVAAALRRSDLRDELLGRIRPLINQGKANA